MLNAHCLEREETNSIQGDFELARKDIPGVEVALVSTEVEYANSEDVFDRWVGGYTEYGLLDV